MAEKAWDQDRFKQPSRIKDGMCEHGCCDWCPQGCFDNDDHHILTYDEIDEINKKITSALKQSEFIDKVSYG